MEKKDKKTEIVNTLTLAPVPNNPHEELMAIFDPPTDLSVENLEKCSFVENRRWAGNRASEIVEKKYGGFNQVTDEQLSQSHKQAWNERVLVYKAMGLETEAEVIDNPEAEKPAEAALSELVKTKKQVTIKYPLECRKRAVYLNSMNYSYEKIRKQLRKGFPSVFTRKKAPSDGWIRNCIMEKQSKKTPEHSVMKTFGSIAVGDEIPINQLPYPKLLAFCKQISADQNEYTKKFLAMQAEVEKLCKENADLKEELGRLQMNEDFEILKKDRQERIKQWREK